MIVKITAVSYLNTIPFIYGLQQSDLIDIIDLSLDYPAVCAEKLINDEVDLALAPIVAIPSLKKSFVISDYCIGANGVVETVCLYSDVTIHNVQSISLDYQSRTSVALLKILLKEYWRLDPELKNLPVGSEARISGKDAALVIGDRAFGLNQKHKYVYDLSDIWRKMTGLPFVFAAWIANKKLPEDFILEFNRCLENGLKNIDKALEEDCNYSCSERNKDYLNNKISYILDVEKWRGMNLFLTKYKLNYFLLFSFFSCCFCNSSSFF